MNVRNPEYDKGVKESDVFVLGSGGHATSVLANLASDGYRIGAVVDEFSKKKEMYGVPILNSLPNDVESPRLVVAIGDNFVRHEISRRVVEIYGEESIMKFISSKSLVSKYAEIQNGCVILANAYIGPGVVISNGSLVNTGAVIEHGSLVGEWASVAPCVALAGEVKIGDFSHVGLASVVESKVRIGNDSVLGSHSYLRKDLGSNLVAHGNPAEVTRPRERGDKYLK